MHKRTARRALAVLAALAVAGFVFFCVDAFTTPSSSYLVLPDKPHPLAPIIKVKPQELVRVKGGYVLPAVTKSYPLTPIIKVKAKALVKVKGGKDNDSGGFYYVDVIERRATLAERYLSFLRDDGSDLVSQAPYNWSARLGASATARSKTIAEVVVLKHLGYYVFIDLEGVQVDQTLEGSPAAAKLRPGDLIVAVDGQATLTKARLIAAIRRHHVGQTIELTIVRVDKRRRIAVPTYAIRSDPHTPRIGVNGSDTQSVILPLKVEINTHNLVGPSAGLAFALELTEKLDGDIDRGYKVAATGELDLDGHVLPIGMVEQKVIGARRAGIEVMLVPAGDNATEARRYAGDMKIIPVTSYQQALRALATLPPRR